MFNWNPTLSRKCFKSNWQEAAGRGGIHLVSLATDRLHWLFAHSRYYLSWYGRICTCIGHANTLRNVEVFFQVCSYAGWSAEQIIDNITASRLTQWKKVTFNNLKVNSGNIWSMVQLQHFFLFPTSQYCSTLDSEYFNLTLIKKYNVSEKHQNFFGNVALRDVSCTAKTCILKMLTCYWCVWKNWGKSNLCTEK